MPIDVLIRYNSRVVSFGHINLGLWPNFPEGINGFLLTYCLISPR